MTWLRNRPLLIGAGAVVVAVVALGVAIANGGSSHRERPYGFMAKRFFVRQYLEPLGGGAPFGGAVPFGDGVAPGYGPGPQFMPAPGAGPMIRRFDGGPGLTSSAGGFFGGPALHGELTVPSKDGKYETIDVQRGTVSKVTATTLTVRSEDGFTRTYAITKSIASGIAKGDEVQLVATVSNGNATVMRLTAISQQKR